MYSLQKLLGVSFTSVGILALVGGAYAATPTARAANDAGGRTNRAGAAAVNRMPTMPTMSINTIGNLTTNLPSNGGVDALPSAVPVVTIACPADATGVYPQCVCVGDKVYNVNTNSCVVCEYTGQTVVNGACACPAGSHADVATKSCVADAECPDGADKNSEYDVARCMNDVYSCVNNGGLPNGINDLFNEDLRNSIENGMALCSVQVERCVTEVRRNCKNVYRTAADVWIDFNARKVQPEYYNFVLRKTGLTPNQAENTCLLLDRNTYGPSFAAVATGGKTTAEYNNRVGAYNGQQGNVLIKNNPQGATVNSGHNGVDGSRGHYARWDAANAECYIRVAAYNKDKPIKNSWLFGAVGDDKMAEVWQRVGDTFSCNKDLFGFSLMKDTNTAAVVGIGGGTLVGAGIGAAAGHGSRSFSCTNEGHRKKAMEQLKQTGKIAILNEYMITPIEAGHDTLSVSECNELLELYQAWKQATTAASTCGGTYIERRTETNTVVATVNCEITADSELTAEELVAAFDECFDKQEVSKPCKGQGFTSAKECVDYLKQLAQDGGATNAVTQTNVENVDNSNCKFRHLNMATGSGIGIYCTASSGCIGAEELLNEAKRLGGVLSNVEILQGEKSNRVKTTLVGAGIGAGAGGVATAITAFVEKNNINCRVGDGLSQVGFGKSHNIETLKDFYVKWNLKLPDSITPTGQANDCNSWRALCGAITDSASCKSANINWRGPEDKTITLIRSACTMSGSQCIENYSVAKSYGACE